VGFHAADHGVVSRIIAAWSPLALLITVELISRVPVHRRALAAVRWLSTATIAGIAAWVSYWHMVAVCQRYGETGLSPYLLPLSVDGLVVVASVCLVELGGRIRAAADSPADSGRIDQATRDVLAEVRPITREATTRLRTQPLMADADMSSAEEPPAVDSAADTADSQPDTAPVRVPGVSAEAAAKIEAAIAAAPTAGQEEIARAASVSVRHVRRYLSGQRTGRRMATA